MSTREVTTLTTDAAQASLSRAILALLARRADPFSCVQAHDPFDQTPRLLDPQARLSLACENPF